VERPEPHFRKRRDPTKVLFAVVAPFQAFFRLEAASGLVMIAAAAIALAWANSPFRKYYDALFHAPIQMKLAERGIDWTVHHFTNDALMTLFFVVAGLEIKRELAQGELRTFSKAALPLIAAAGGMIVPALIYVGFNPAEPARAGWAIPMATDIAFALGCLSLVRGRVPSSVFVFLTALAIFDDLGAIAVIALFYGGAIQVELLVVAFFLSSLLVLLGRARVQAIWPYAVLGVLLWVAALQAGIHATVAGVVIGLSMTTVPRHAPRETLDELDHAVTALRKDCDSNLVLAQDAIIAIERHLEDGSSPVNRAMQWLHGPVAFGIVPLFALANAGVTVGSGTALTSPVTLGAFLGLFLGKPIGVLGATWLATRLRLADRPSGATFTQLFGTSLMAGIGFTMSLLVGNLGLGGTRGLEDQAKIGVLSASFLAALVGLVVFRQSRPLSAPEDELALAKSDAPPARAS